MQQRSHLRPHHKSRASTQFKKAKQRMTCRSIFPSRVTATARVRHLSLPLSFRLRAKRAAQMSANNPARFKTLQKIRRSTSVQNPKTQVALDCRVQSCVTRWVRVRGQLPLRPRRPQPKWPCVRTANLCLRRILQNLQHHLSCFYMAMAQLENNKKLI